MVAKCSVFRLISLLFGLITVVIIDDTGLLFMISFDEYCVCNQCRSFFCVNFVQTLL